MALHEGRGPKLTSSLRETMARRNGPRRLIFGVKPNKTYAEAKRLGMHTMEGPYTQNGSYIGEWAGDQKEGFGQQTWTNGNKYEGEFVADLRHGKGTLYIREGKHLRKQYAGDWVAGKRQGLGVCMSSGEPPSVYEGEWLMNKRHGRGKQTYPNGDVYEGDWEDGARSGLGVLTRPNGDRFEGQWLEGQKEGPGQYHFLSTAKILDGEWVADVAKCGEYRDAGPSSGDAQMPAPDAFEIPQLTLENPGGVLAEAVAVARQARASRVAAGRTAMEATFMDETGPPLPGATAAPPVFTPEQISRLRAHFDRFVAAEPDGTPKQPPAVRAEQLGEMLGALGQNVAEGELQALRRHMGADGDTPITLADFVDIVSLFFE